MFCLTTLPYIRVLAGSAALRQSPHVGVLLCWSLAGKDIYLGDQPLTARVRVCQWSGLLQHDLLLGVHHLQQNEQQGDAHSITPYLHAHASWHGYSRHLPIGYWKLGIEQLIGLCTSLREANLVRSI